MASVFTIDESLVKRRIAIPNTNYQFILTTSGLLFSLNDDTITHVKNSGLVSDIKLNDRNGITGYDKDNNLFCIATNMGQASGFLGVKYNGSNF